MPPEGDWIIWLILAGRGFGKTRCTVEWVRREVEAGRAGRIALVGATASDVRDILVDGESGILATAPNWNRPVWEPSKTRLTWPNGAQAFTYTAEEPDRLRGKQHDAAACDELACLVAGTLIATSRGPRRIEDVRKGDLVRTRMGMRPVARAEKTSDAEEIFCVTTTGGLILHGTWNHQVWTANRGFVYLASLVRGDILLSCSAESIGVAGAGIRTRETGTSAIGSESYSTAPFGLKSAGLFRQAGKCITRTKIALTTRLRTLKRCPRHNTNSSTNRVAGWVGTRTEGTRTRSPLGTGASLRTSSASSARKRSLRPVCGRGFAPQLVGRLTAESRASTTRSASAFSARPRSLSTDTSPLRHAHDRVLSVSVEPKKSAVYDIGVCGVHEYFANGILVHNSWRYPDTWDQLMFGLRLGTNPRCVVATTPRPTPIIKSLVARSSDPSDVRLSRGSTLDNKANLAATFIHQVIQRYEGTRLGRQEIHGDVLDDNPSALWQRARIDELRVVKHPDLTRVVVAVDPAVTSHQGGGSRNEATQSTRERISDETGIVVVGVGVDRHVYVLADCTLRDTPARWAAAAVTAFHKYRADRIIAEVNQGGDMVEATIRTVDARIPYRSVHATRGKAVRAEPVASLYERGFVHHVGTFPQLEDQMVEWDPSSGGKSPDRVDALVWGITDFMGAPSPSRDLSGLPPR